MRRRRFEKIVRHIRGTRSSVVIFERNGYRGLRFADNDVLIQGIMNTQRPLDFKSEYVKQQLAGAVCHPHPRSGLCLGLGIGAVPRLWKAAWPQMHIDIVENCDAVISAARDFFGIETSSDFRVHLGDAARAVHQVALHGVYDLVFVDCYTADAIPPTCRTQSFIEGCIRCLSSQGLLLANLLPDRRGAQAVYKHLNSQLLSPIALVARQKTNHAIIGHVSTQIDITDALTRAHCLDRSGRLPFALTPELKMARDLSECDDAFTDKNGAFAADNEHGFSES